jgi:UDP-glucose 4-epimerase
VKSVRVLVTGGSGFIGSHLLNRLKAEGTNTLSVDIKNVKKPIDIRNPTQLNEVVQSFDPDVIVHLAAIASIPRCEAHIWLAYTTNVLGTCNLVRLCSGRRLLFASSAAVYGYHYHGPISEDALPSPTNHYGLTKLAGEMQVMRNVENFAIFRIFNVYGPNCHRSYVIPDLISKIRMASNIVKVQGTGDEIRDFIYIDDLLDVLVYFMKNEIKGIFNIGTGKPITIRQLAYIIATLLGKPWIKFKFESQHRMGDIPVLWANISKVSSVTGWSPKVDLQSGLKKILTAEGYCPNRALNTL